MSGKGTEKAPEWPLVGSRVVDPQDATGTARAVWSTTDRHGDLAAWWVAVEYDAGQEPEWAADADLDDDTAKVQADLGLEPGTWLAWPVGDLKPEGDDDPDSGRPGTWLCAVCGWEGEAADLEDAEWQHAYGPYAAEPRHPFRDADAEDGAR
ncbi:MAG TPA: hypothetical protein VFU43_25250 [Streptosporangiaceae bacterium]|nr:hypothetical protein [Streptosporangiaceae bacterium]